MRWLSCVVALAALSGGADAGVVTISEVQYDAVGADDGRVFVELHGPAGFPLAGWFLEGVNGSGGGTTHFVDLSAATIPADGFLVLADSLAGGGTWVEQADLLFPDLDLQNGPDSLRLLEGAVTVDALGYGVFGAGLVFAGEGLPAPDVPAGASLARVFADLDTDVNLVDFEVLGTPTPGSGPVFGEPVSTPEPAGVLLLGSGLLALALTRRSRRLRRRPWRRTGDGRG